MSSNRDNHQVYKNFSETFDDDDEEPQLEFMGSKGPPGHTGTPVNRVVKEVKRNWWLWGAVCFAMVLITSVVMFRHKLFNTGDIGLPFLAVKENAAETCSAKCRATSSDLSLSADTDHDIKNKQEFDACYSKCVSQETKEVAAEREKFKREEEEMEKQVEESMGKIATASDTKAAKVDQSLSGGDSATSLGALDDVLDLDIPEGVADR